MTDLVNPFSAMFHVKHFYIRRQQASFHRESEHDTSERVFADKRMFHVKHFWHRLRTIKGRGVRTMFHVKHACILADQTDRQDWLDMSCQMVVYLPLLDVLHS